MGGATTIRVHYPAGTHKLTMRGAAGGLSWTQGATMASGASDTWTWTSTTLTGVSEYKPLLDDATWALGPNYHVTAGSTLDIYPHFTTTVGTVSKLLTNFKSTNLPNSTRNIWVYQPPTYLENTRAALPVVYMHDGQNLFDPALAFGGNPWMANAAIDSAANTGTCATGSACMNDGDCGGSSCQTFREALIIGVENDADRIPEYTPVADPGYGGGNGDAYLKMLRDELKPKVDAMLRTLPGPADTAMVGSSLGGLITAYAGTTQSGTWGLLGVMSPSTWWDSTIIITDVKNSAAEKPRLVRVYVDSGDAGTDNDDYMNTAKLSMTYQANGYTIGKDLDYVLQHGGQHNEIYWAQRLPGALAFLLGPR